MDGQTIRPRRAAVRCFAAALGLYGVVACSWSQRFAAATLPVDTVFGLDTLATYDAATDPQYRNDRLFALHPLYAAALHLLTAPVVAAGLDAKHALLVLTVLAAALQVMLLDRIVARCALPAPAHFGIVVAFAGSFALLVQSTAPDSFVFSGLAFLLLLHHAARVVLEGRPASPLRLGVIGTALMGTTVSNVVPFALASSLIATRRRWVMYAGVVAAVVVGSYVQRRWLPHAAWFPAYFAAAAHGTEPLTHFVNASASVATAAGEALRNLLVIPWLFAGFVRTAAAPGAVVFFPRPPSWPAWILWAAAVLGLAWCATRAAWPAPWRRFAAVVASVFLFHCAFHLVYGRLEAYLYAPHYLGATAVLVALALRGQGPAPSAAARLVALAALALVASNFVQLARFHAALADAFATCTLSRNADGSAVCR